jgi:hypothetical protein
MWPPLFVPENIREPTERNLTLDRRESMNERCRFRDGARPTLSDECSGVTWDPVANYGQAERARPMGVEPALVGSHRLRS